MPEFTITRLGLKGDGIAGSDIFAPFTLPGEKVVGEVSGGQLIGDRISDSPDRVAPVCQHFGICGYNLTAHLVDIAVM